MSGTKRRNNERIADAELDIMRVLWQTGRSLRASEIVKMLSETRSWKTQTAHVLLNRLEEKGFIEADRSGYYHEYRYLVSERDYFISESGSLLRRIGGNLKTMMVSLVDTENITEEDLLEMYEILDKKREELKGRRAGEQ